MKSSQFCEAMLDAGIADAIVRVKVAPACEHEVEQAITASSLGSPGILREGPSWRGEAALNLRQWGSKICCSAAEEMIDDR